MVFDEELEVLYRLEAICLEDLGVRGRVRDQVLRCREADLGVGVGDEADELFCAALARVAHECMPPCRAHSSGGAYGRTYLF